MADRFRRPTQSRTPHEGPASTEGLSDEELEAERVEHLPDREALSMLRGDVTIPLDPDIAADVLLDQDSSSDDDAG